MTLPVANWNLEHLSVYFSVILPFKRDINVIIQKNENIISMDVTFFENQPFYTKNSLQGENLGDENFWNVTLPSVPPSIGILASP